MCSITGIINFDNLKKQNIKTAKIAAFTKIHKRITIKKKFVK